MEPLEISDLIVRYDAETLERLPVRRSDVVEQLETASDARGAAIARRLPVRDGDVFDEAQIDALLLRVHAELQRLSEEFQQGRRVEQVLVPLVRALQRSSGSDPVSVVDVGCGLGFLVRWLAARSAVAGTVSLTGCDYNASLIDAADRLARDEGLRCEFLVANAFTLDRPSSIFVSTGVVHHFRGDDLVSFFGAQEAAGASAFLHYDTSPTALAPFGAWLFHWARMREPLSRHDGMQSVRRAHRDDELVRAMREGAPSMVPVMVDRVGSRHPLLNVLRPIIGLEPGVVDSFVDALGRLGSRVEVFA